MGKPARDLVSQGGWPAGGEHFNVGSDVGLLYSLSNSPSALRAAIAVGPQSLSQRCYFWNTIRPSVPSSFPSDHLPPLNAYELLRRTFYAWRCCRRRHGRWVAASAAICFIKRML